MRVRESIVKSEKPERHRFAPPDLTDALDCVALKKPVLFGKRQRTLLEMFNDPKIAENGWEASGYSKNTLCDAFSDVLPEMAYAEMDDRVLANALGAFRLVMDEGDAGQKQRVEGVLPALNGRVRQSIKSKIGSDKDAERYSEMMGETMMEKGRGDVAKWAYDYLRGLEVLKGIGSRHAFVKDGGDIRFMDRKSPEWRGLDIKKRLSSIEVRWDIIPGVKTVKRTLYDLFTSREIAERGFEESGPPRKKLCEALTGYMDEALYGAEKDPHGTTIMRNAKQAYDFVMKYGDRYQKGRVEQYSKGVRKAAADFVGDLMRSKDPNTHLFQDELVKDDFMMQALTDHLRWCYDRDGGHEYQANCFEAFTRIIMHGKEAQKKELEGFANRIYGGLSSSLQKMGYDKRFSDDVVRDWWNVGWGNCKRGGFTYNSLKTLSELSEKGRKDVAVRMNRECNISMFGRYTVDILERAYRDLDREDVPYIISAMVKDDHNAAFSKNPNNQIHQRLHEQLGGECAIRLYEVDSPVHAIRTLKRTVKRLGNPLVASLDLHSSPKTMAFNTYKKDEQLTMDHLHEARNGDKAKNKLLERMKGLLAPKTILVLSGCELGEKGGIGQELSGELDLTVIGTRGISGFKDLKLHKRGEYVIPEIFKHDKRRRTYRTRVFVSGREIGLGRYLRMDFEYQKGFDPHEKHKRAA